MFYQLINREIKKKNLKAFSALPIIPHTKPPTNPKGNYTDMIVML